MLYGGVWPARRVVLELVHRHRSGGEPLERRPSHEPLAGGRLDHAHRVAGLDREARELDGLVGGDPARYAEEDPGHGAASRGPLPAVAVLQLVAGDLLEGDLEVVLRAGVDHRRRGLVERSLAGVVAV